MRSIFVLRVEPAHGALNKYDCDAYSSVDLLASSMERGVQSQCRIFIHPVNGRHGSSMFLVLESCLIVNKKVKKNDPIFFSREFFLCVVCGILCNKLRGIQLNINRVLQIIFFLLENSSGNFALKNVQNLDTYTQNTRVLVPISKWEMKEIFPQIKFYHKNYKRQGKKIRRQHP